MLYISHFYFDLSVSWSKDGRPIDDSGRFAFAQDGNNATFTIPAALSTDSGSYTVTAKDERGQNSWTFSLVVRIGDSSAGDVDVQQLIDSVQVSLLLKQLFCWFQSQIFLFICTSYFLLVLAHSQKLKLSVVRMN